MKQLRSIFPILFLSLALVLLYMEVTGRIPRSVLYGFSGTMLLFFLFNLWVRKSNSFKNYFMSDWNFFTKKFVTQNEYDISGSLMLAKIEEVIEDSKFNIQNIDHTHHEILATTSTTWKSWGENIYITLVEKNEKTVMYFCSVTLFQMTSWGKNKQNFNQLVDDIDQSLII